MSVVIRLKTTGTKKKIKHRIVVADTHFPRNGRILEEIGYWDSSKEPPIFGVKAERAKHWMSMGAKPTATVKSIFKRASIK